MMRFTATLVVAALTLGGMSGCFKGEEDTCEYWGSKLAKSAAIDRAMKKVAQLKCTSALPTLKQLYEEGQFQASILQTIKEIGDREGAVPILEMALKSSTESKLAASIVSDWKLSQMKKPLVEILTGDKMPQNRGAALDALLSFEDPHNFEDALIELAGYDPNIQGHEVNARAIAELGNIGSKKAIPTLIKMAYMRTNKGAEVYRDVRRALAQIGGVAPALLKVLKGEDEGVKEFTRSIGVQDWESRYGPKTVQLLVDTLDPAAVPALVKSMSDELAPPAGVSDKALNQWQNGQRNRLKVLMFGLAQIGSDVGVAPLIAIIKDPMKDTVNQRLNAATTLAMIGTDAAQTALIEVWKSETNQAFKRPLLQQLALGIDHAQLKPLEEEIKKDEALIKEKVAKFAVALEAVKSKLASAEVGSDEAKRLQQQVNFAEADRDAFQLTLDKNAAYFNVVRECQDNPSCYLKKTKSDSQDEVVKAINILSRGKIGDKARVLDTLLEVFSGATKKQTDIKRFALIGITRLGDKRTGEKLVTMSEELPSSDSFWKDELFAFGQGLIHTRK